MIEEVVERGERVFVRKINESDRDEFIDLALKSLELHRQWILLPQTHEHFTRYLDGFREGVAAGFVVCENTLGTIVGFININGVVGAPYRRGILGYGVFSPSAGQHYLGEGLPLVVEHGLGKMGLHRLEADVRPNNVASIKLVRRAGFRREGISEGFIFMDGEWRDHERWAVTAEILRKGPAAS